MDGIGFQLARNEISYRKKALAIGKSRHYRVYTVMGHHFIETAEAWLENLDARREAALPVLAAAYGADEAQRWLQRWRLFFMACAELFAFNNGQEWWVSHYLFERAAHQAGASLSVTAN